MILLAFDVLLTAIIAWLILRFFNTRRGLAYLGVTILILAILTSTAYFQLPALHYLSQAMLISLVIGVPVYFYEQWHEMFSPKTPTTISSPPYLNGFFLGVIALLVAAVLALINNGPTLKTAELPQAIPVGAVNVKEGLSANFGSQKRIQLIVRANRNTWERLTESDFSASVDLANREAGTYEVGLNVSSKISGVEIVRSQPNQVTVTLEPVITKTVPIGAKFTGKAGEELIPDEPSFDPDKAEITGPKSVIEDIRQAYAVIKLDNQTKPIEQTIKLVALNSQGQPIEDVSFAPAETKVNVKLVKAGKLKAVSVKPITSGQPENGYWVSSLSVTPNFVTVNGNIETLETLAFVPTEPIALTGLKANTDLTVALAYPTGITSADNQTKVSVKVTVEESQTTKQLSPQVQYVGLDAGLKVTSVSSSITATVSGKSASLANLAAADVILKLDLAPYKSAGSYSVQIKTENFTLPSGISLVSFLPSAVNVTLEVR